MSNGMTSFSPADLPEHAARWGRVLEEFDRKGAVWDPSELGAVLQHQLAAPVEFAPLEPPAPPAEPAKSSPPPAPAAAPPGIRSFGELLCHPRPPLPLLVQLKEFAKVNRGHPQSALPEPLCAVLYFAAIAAARVRLGADITKMDRADLQAGLQWCLHLDWLDSATRELLIQAAARPVSPGGV
jgi:hypothetical protein